MSDHIEDAGRVLVPYSPDNNLMQHDVVQFPTRPEEYGEQDELASEVQEFIHR